MEISWDGTGIKCYVMGQTNKSYGQYQGGSANQWRIQPVSLKGAISVIFGSQVSVGSQVSFRIVQNHGDKSYFRRI